MIDRALLVVPFAALTFASSLLACSCNETRRAIVGAVDPGGGRYEAPDVVAEASAATAVRLDEVASGFTQPTDLQFPPGHARTLVVLEKTGEAHALSLERPKERRVLFSVEVKTESELGLLGLAFHPRFAENGRFFVNYNPKGGELRTRVAEWHTDPKTLEGAREVKLVLEVEQPYQNHDAGQLAFGPDGFLYVGLGDGGWRADPGEHGQNKETLLGSMLRLDVDDVPAGKGYGVPQDNPFVGERGARPEIWAYGLRNPWRYSFDEKGRLVVADVGQDAWEEVSIVEKGDNLGWDVMEGRHCFEPAQGCDESGKKPPVWEYPREQGQSITGGYVYTGALVPGLKGKYLVADFVLGNLWALALPDDARGQAQATHLGRWPMLFSTFGRDASGEVYLADFGAGVVYRLAAK